MSARAVAAGRPSLRIRGTRYPVLLPSVRDPRLHLAAVIITLQVLGQTAFGFQLSIAQILVSLLTCAVLEIAIAFRRQRVLMWPASALLTGNGVAFVLRVPGTEHGDWWSLNGWWIFAGTAAVALLSKYLIVFRGRHVFNPSNFGLVLCFLVLGSGRADPLDLWWGPMSAWMALALAVIVIGGLAILTRLRLLEIAVFFWIAFAAGIAVLAASGHAMTARWHLGPVTGWEFWRVLVFSPEILVFLFFMITDPRTIPAGRRGRRMYAAGIGLLATLLIAPQTTEFGTKVAVLGALALACAARPAAEVLGERISARWRPGGRRRAGALALAGAAAFAGLVILAGIPARTDVAAAGAPALRPGELPDITIVPADDVSTQIDRETAVRIASDLVTNLRVEGEALAGRDRQGAAEAAAGARLAALWQQIDGARDQVVVPGYRIEHVELRLEPSDGQAPPLVVATASGTRELVTYAGSPAAVESRSDPTPFEQTFELDLQGGRYLIVGVRGGDSAVPAAQPVASGAGLGGIHFADVARHVGLDFRHGAFRFETSPDPVAMMGGGVCWLDYDGDGWLDLYAVNSHSIAVDVARWKERGGLPRNALYRNVEGTFTDVSRGSGADVQLRGNGCVAADFDGDGRTDLYVTATGYDALLWNEGGGKFVEGARAAGIDTYGWHAAAAVGDVNADGLPDLFVAGYADLNAPVEGAVGFPSTYAGVRDRLYLNLGPDESGLARFREVAEQVGIETGPVEHGLGAAFTDVNGDGRVDLYVANDLDPNRLYLNVPSQGGLGFRFEERGAAAGVADRNAGMGIAAADASGDGRPDLFVTNSHRQLHGVFRSRGRGFELADARPDFAPAFDTTLAGWGAAWADLDLDGRLDLAFANGAIPVTNLDMDAEPVKVLSGRSGEVADVSAGVGLGEGPLVNGRGLAAADYDNDGDLDLAVGSIGGPLVLLRNSGAEGHWLEVRLRSFAPGARVTAVLPGGRRLVREAQAGGSYLSSEDPRVHFGLGTAARVRALVVRYPTGREVRLENVAADRVVAVG
jgi:ASPIC and UnbV/FG-GAP-like repeat/NQR2, RnfD, RnfE family